MRIPKIIHYVWMGGNPKSKTIQRCMKSWEKHLGDYEIIEWNESNFDINSVPYVKHAYKQKKWAFVSDYIRAYAVYTYGGIYLDTDVMVLDNLSSFLNHRAFVGFENEKYPFTAVFGAEPGHPLLKDMLGLYNTDFVFNHEDQLIQTNTRTVSEILVNKYGCNENNKFQILDEDIAVYPDEVLCNPSSRSSAIHIFTGTWMEGKKGISRKTVKFMKEHLTTKFKAELYRLLIQRNKHEK